MRARIDAMKPARAGSTRTAAPRMPDQFWTRGRYLGYIAFGACGFFLMLVPLGLLRAAWILGSGDAAAWDALLASYAHPVYVAFHALSLLALVWFALRLFRIFAKTQPPKLGPFPRPPDAFFPVALTGAFLAATAGLSAVLWGVVP